jgi:alkanesulfonate monooxygenase SsuD/methylene tetrahydromethanopterin reductase-like flavin-dependent oxidoreductase (luciferase family)
MSEGMRIGVLLPHFGAAASPARIIDQSRRIEQLGYDSVWVRDHLVWRPHGMEGTDITFVEPFVCLAAIGAVTQRLTLGTAVLIPVRWPLKLAQDLASLSYLVGPRIIAGIGMGFNPGEFAAAGLSYERRAEITRETVDICRRVWAADDVSFAGDIFQFEHFSLKPKPAGPIPFWYGGSTRASVRRAVDYCDGWLPGRLPFLTLDNRLALLRELGARAGKQMRASAIPLIKIGRTREDGRRGIDIDALGGSSEGAKHWIKPPSGRFETLEDLDGLIIAGSPEDCAEGLRKFAARGIDHVVLDFRLQFDEFEWAVEAVAEHVLPQVRSTPQVLSGDRPGSG